MFTYLIILAAVLVISPFVLKLASNQGKKTKQNFKSFLLILLSAQILLGFLNWENFSVGRSGYEFALSYPQSFLSLFFIITALQILLFFSQKFYTLAVILNFINTITFFTGMIRIGQITGIQTATWASIGTVFAVLIGNVVGLVLINKDKSLLRKYL